MALARSGTDFTFKLTMPNSVTTYIMSERGVVVLQGAGRAFCAGHDLKEMRDARFGGAYLEALFAECAKVMLAILRLPQPVIAQVMAHNLATRDAQEGIGAFLDKRNPVWSGQ